MSRERSETGDEHPTSLRTPNVRSFSTNALLVRTA